LDLVISKESHNDDGTDPTKLFTSIRRVTVSRKMDTSVEVSFAAK
jgi:hypothetical protein